MPKSRSGGLTEKQKAFCREYVKDFNGTQACIRAGYSKKTARVQGTENLAKPAIAAHLQALTAKADDSAIATHAECCEILTAIARGTPADFLEIIDGEVRITMDPDTARNHALAGVETTRTTNDQGDTRSITKLKLTGKTQAIERLSKMRGYDTPEQHEVTATQHVFADAPEGE